MPKRTPGLLSEKEPQKAILQEKLKGTSDAEIGRKYEVTFRYIWI